MLAAVTLLGAYLLGSIPFSFLVARRWGIQDVRAVGSGNVGATNVMRSAGPIPGLLAFLLDALKGAAAALLALRFEATAGLAPQAAAAAVVGHMYPVWIGFRGGKGVATGAGAFLPLAPGPTGIALAAFGVTLAATRYVSLSSIVGAAALAAAAFALGAHARVAWAAVGVGALIVWKHRGNIKRLLEGTESRIGRKS